MRINRKITTVLLAMSLSTATQAQQTISLHSRQGCQLFDIRNIKEMRVEHDTLTADFGSLQLQVPFDSIAFADDSGAGMRTGWWGEAADGTSTCYYWPDSANIPNVEIATADGLCTSAQCIVAHEPSPAAHKPRRVGTKWRYTMGTLTGRKRVHISLFSPSCYQHYTLMADAPYPADTHSCYDFSAMFAGMPSHTARRTMNYWHRPEAVAAMPDSIVFGAFDGVARYAYPLAGDSIHVVVALDLDSARPDSIFGDTLQLVFADEWLAQTAYEELDSIEDPLTNVGLFGNVISITERFEATFSEVHEWLVRFDLDLTRPLFLRKDE